MILLAQPHICESSWSFSVNGALEGAYFVRYGERTYFSEQVSTIIIKDIKKKKIQIIYKLNLISNARRGTVIEKG